jgi:hypothetical protein
MSVINWTNVSSFGDLPSLANTASGGTFWVGILHMVWIILILVLIGYGFEVAITVASFLAMIIAFMMVYADLVNWIFIVEFAGLLLFMYLYIIWSGRKDRQ